MTPYRTVVCIGTGPSLTLDQIEIARAKGFALFGCNIIYQSVPDLALTFATNESFWDFYWARPDSPRLHPCEKWTNSREAAEHYRLNFIASHEDGGLGFPDHIHHGHSSGACLVNLAYLLGATRIVLLGYDMRYAPDYDGVNHKVGSTPRHFFGEYVSALQHWPKAEVKAGVHVGLVEHYNSIARQGLVEIVNATPDSAIRCFPMCSMEELAMTTISKPGHQGPPPATPTAPPAAKPAAPEQPSIEGSPLAKPGEPGSASSSWDKEHEPYKVPPFEAPK
jgi:hypothetical protein